MPEDSCLQKHCNPVCGDRACNFSQAGVQFSRPHLDVLFLDNSAALSAFLRGSGSTALASNMVRHAMQFESDNALVTWYSRVPSASNPADKSSRLQVKALLERGVMFVRVASVLVARLCR